MIISPAWYTVGQSFMPGLAFACGTVLEPDVDVIVHEVGHVPRAAHGAGEMSINATKSGKPAVVVFSSRYAVVGILKKYETLYRWYSMHAKCWKTGKCSYMVEDMKIDMPRSR